MVLVIFIAMSLFSTALAAGEKTVRSTGYVSFYQNNGSLSNDIGLEITTIVDGKELKKQLNFNKGTTVSDYRIEAEPGDREFVVRHNFDPSQSKYRNEERFRVTVKESMVTYISFRRQGISYNEDKLLTVTNSTYKYFVRATVGTHPLPAEENVNAIAQYVDALQDNDWGTRHAALKALRRFSPVLGPQTIALLQAMAREDVSFFVRTEATELLEAQNPKHLSKPLFIQTFFDSSDTGSSYAWYQGQFMGRDPEGYFIAPNDENFLWSSINWSDIAVFEGFWKGTRKVIVPPDFDAILDCAWRGGINNAAYGLILGKDKSDFYSFGISRNGGAIVNRWSGSNITATPIPWKQDAATTIAERDFSRIVVAKHGNTYTFTVNGVPIGTFTDAQMLPVQVIGLIAGNRQKAVFKRIIVDAYKIR